MLPAMGSEWGCSQAFGVLSDFCSGIIFPNSAGGAIKLQFRVDVLLFASLFPEKNKNNIIKKCNF
jgi:hypothetical protein